MNIKKIAVSAGVLAALVLAGTFLLGKRGMPPEDASLADARTGAEMTALEHAKQHLDPTYVCPMHPEVVSAEPGDCPICGMALVARAPADAASAGVAPAGKAERAAGAMIHVSPAVVNQLGVRTAPVERGTLWRRIETVGYVSQSLASAYYSRTYNPSAGRVARPQRTTAAADTAEDEAEVKQVIIAGEVFERHAHLLEEGQGAEFRVPHLPGRVWRGTVKWLDPEVDPTKRTFLFSMEADDPDDVLKTNMRGDVTLFSEPQRDVLMIPREALIVTGASQRVVAALGEGRFQPREVITGGESGDRVAVLSGLEEGEEVVTSAQFLLDSEANLQAGLQRLANDDEAWEAGR